MWWSRSERDWKVLWNPIDPTLSLCLHSKESGYRTHQSPCGARWRARQLSAEPPGSAETLTVIVIDVLDEHTGEGPRTASLSVMERLVEEGLHVKFLPSSPVSVSGSSSRLLKFLPFTSYRDTGDFVGWRGCERLEAPAEFAAEEPLGLVMLVVKPACVPLCHCCQ